MATEAIAEGQGRLARRIAVAVLSQRGHLLGWVPVCLGIGIALWFGLADEPGLPFYSGLVAIAVGALVSARFAGPVIAPFLIALALVSAGALIAGLRAHQVAAPKLEFRYYGAIEGRVIKIDRSASDALRLTLDRVRLDRLAPDRTPERVRVALHGGHGPTAPAPGQIVVLTGHLSPPGGPVEPGGFDFARNAWFDRLGAVGYARTPALLLRPSQGGWALAVHRLRDRLSKGLQTALGPQTGGVAAAIVTGDRSGIPREVTEQLRASNLAHLLAISGLHMGLLVGVVFGAARYGAALVPRVALYWPVKKLAAGAALIAGAFYLALSGGSVATERAFIMVSVMLLAVMLDRRALTLRAVALAATIVLLRRPEELLGPGFQMSFAATTALVAGFGWLRTIDTPRLPYVGRNVGGVFMSSLIAGLATAPFAAAHFNIVSHYGLVANLLAVPVMGAVVVPAAVLAAVLWCVGLAPLALWAMDLGLRWIILVAATVSRQPGAVGHVPTPDGPVLGILALGLLFAVLWQGRLRWAGWAVLPVVAYIWATSERPELLISSTGGLIGVAGDGGRVLSKEKGDGFSASSWLENDGDGVDQFVAAARGGLVVEGRVARASLGGVEVIHVRGKRALEALEACGGADILISDQVVEDTRPCTVLDLKRLRKTGAVAGYVTADGLVLVTSASRTGSRVWAATDPGDALSTIPPARSR